MQSLKLSSEFLYARVFKCAVRPGLADRKSILIEKGASDKELVVQ